MDEEDARKIIHALKIQISDLNKFLQEKDLDNEFTKWIERDIPKKQQDDLK